MNEAGVINKDFEEFVSLGYTTNTTLMGNLGYKINFGQNYFNKKKYKGITYEEGYYESLLIILGKGEGDNWWCVLFPPLCLIEAEESDKVEYKFFIKELIEKYL